MMRQTVPLRRVFKVINGGTPSSDEVNWEGGIEWATPADFGANFSRLSSTRRTITRTGLKNGSTLVPRGTVLLSTRAPIGYVALTSHETAFNQGCRALLPHVEVDARFYGYQLEARRDELQAHGLGTTFVELSSDSLSAFPLYTCPITHQRRIADFLEAETARIDQLVNNFSRLKVLLIERHQRVIDTSIGSIRSTAIPLKYALRFLEGPGIMAEDFRDSGVPLIRVRGLKDGNVTLNGCNFLDVAMVKKRWGKYALRLGDRVISGSATMGEVSSVSSPSVVGAIPYTGLIILRPIFQEVNMDYVECFLQSSAFFKQIDALKAGAAMQHFGPTHLARIRIPLPEANTQIQIFQKTENARSQMRQMSGLVDRQLSLLEERRRALITAAVTGQFDVSAASGRGVTE